MTVSKSIVTGGALAFAILFGGGAFLIMNMAPLSKSYIEKIARQTLGVDVRIEKLDINLKEKQATVTNIMIGNPSGFDRPYAMHIQSIEIGIDSIKEGLVTLDSMTINNPLTHIEIKENGTNLQTINASIKSTARQEQENEKINANNKSGNNVIINDTLFRDVALSASSPYYKRDFGPVKIRDAKLKSTGRKDGGVSPKYAIAEISATILHYLNQQALQRQLYMGLSAETLKSLGATPVDRIKTRLNEELNKLKDSLTLTPPKINTGNTRYMKEPLKQK